MRNLHPIFQQALAPFAPGLMDDLKPFPALPTRREELMDEYRTGLDKTGPQWDEEERDE